MSEAKKDESDLSGLLCAELKVKVKDALEELMKNEPPKHVGLLGTPHYQKAYSDICNAIDKLIVA